MMESLVLGAVAAACSVQTPHAGEREPRKCVIDGARYAHGVANPHNECEWCQTGDRRDAWTAKPYGSPCDDGLTCTENDTCQAGECWSGSPRGCPGPWADSVLDPATYRMDDGRAQVLTKRGGSTFVRDEVLVVVAEGTPRREVDQIAAGLGGAVIRQIPQMRLYVLRFAVDTPEQLEAKRAALAEQPRVRVASFNLVTVGK